MERDTWEGGTEFLPFPWLLGKVSPLSAVRRGQAEETSARGLAGMRHLCVGCFGRACGPRGATGVLVAQVRSRAPVGARRPSHSLRARGSSVPFSLQHPALRAGGAGQRSLLTTRRRILPHEPSPRKRGRGIGTMETS